jgi:hypothetical protein
MAREVLQKEGTSTVDLLVLTSLDQFLFTLKLLFTFCKTSLLNEEINFTETSPKLVRHSDSPYQHKDRKTDRQTDIHKNKRIDKYENRTDRHTDGGHTDIQLEDRET